MLSLFKTIHVKSKTRCVYNTCKTCVIRIMLIANATCLVAARVCRIDQEAVEIDAENKRIAAAAAAQTSE